MRTYVYRLNVFLAKGLGLWVLKLFVWIVASGYYLFFPRRVAASMGFYRALFPGRSFFLSLLRLEAVPFVHHNLCGPLYSQA